VPARVANFVNSNRWYKTVLDSSLIHIKWKPIFVQNTNFQRHTNPKLLDRQIRATFRRIQQNVHRYIDLQINRFYDHSTPLERNQNIQPGCNGSRTGGSDDHAATSPPPPPAHRPRSQLSQIQKLTQAQAPSDASKNNMPVIRMEAARNIQSDDLTVLKKIGKFTVETPAHMLSYGKLRSNNENPTKNRE
jgi:hypothetical protein